MTPPEPFIAASTTVAPSGDNSAVNGQIIEPNRDGFAGLSILLTSVPPAAWVASRSVRLAVASVKGMRSISAFIGCPCASFSPSF